MNTEVCNFDPKRGVVYFAKVTKNNRTTVYDCIKHYTENDKASIILTNSGTSALLCALFACDLKPGDRVIGPNYGYFAWFNVSRFLQLNPLICDVNRNTFGLSYEHVKKVIQKDKNKTIKVIFYVYHVGILDSDILKIRELCDENNIILIEDSCYALGVKHSQFKPFSIGDLSAISFSEKKLVDSGEGGALLVNNSKFLEKAMECQFQGNWHRAEKSKLPVGINIQMSEVIQNYLITAFTSLPDKIKERERIFKEILSFDLPLVFDERQTSPGRFILNCDNANARNIINFIKKFYRNKSLDLEVNHNYKSLSSLGFSNLQDEYCENLLYLPVYNEIDRTLILFLKKALSKV